MTQTAALPSTEIARSQGLLGRTIGIIFSPRATYEGVAAHPRALGVLALFLGVVIAASATLMSTQVGKEALVDQQIRTIESFGRQVPDAAYDRLQTMAQYAPYFSAVSSLVLYPLAALVVSGILVAVFNAALGGVATFKQVYAVVVHSFIVIGLQRLFASPLDYAKQSLSSPTNLAVFLPFLDEGSFLAVLLGSIDLFLIWWIVNLAIGVGVLYRKRTGPIAATMLIVYGVIALVVAAVRTVMSGA